LFRISQKSFNYVIMDPIHEIPHDRQWGRKENAPLTIKVIVKFSPRDG